MPHPSAHLLSISEVATLLGLSVVRGRVQCHNHRAHRGGVDRNPSLQFYDNSNRFKCYACGVSGDAIDLVRGIKGLTFPQATRWLELAVNSLSARDPDVVKNFQSPAPESPQVVKCRHAIYSALAANCNPPVPDSPGGDYLLNRGLDLNLAATHGVKEILDPDHVWRNLNNKFTTEELQISGLVSRSNLFLLRRHRLMFFYLEAGQPVYLQGRSLRAETLPKELSLSGVSPPVLYNVDALADGPDSIHICEGAIDTLSALQLGLPAVGVPGVSGFRSEWFELFKNIKQVVCLFDGDDAGRRMAGRLAMDFRGHGVEARAFTPPPNSDMNDLLSKLSEGH